jgi:hypothetical protein
VFGGRDVLPDIVMSPPVSGRDVGVTEIVKPAEFFLVKRYAEAAPIATAATAPTPNAVLSDFDNGMVCSRERLI